MITSPLLSNVCHRATIAPVSPLLIGSFILARVTGQFFVHLILFWKWELSTEFDFKHNILYKSTASKNIKSDMNYVLKSNQLHRAARTLNRWAWVKRERTKSREHQNSRQKVFSRKALRLFRGAWHLEIWQKLHRFIVLHNSIWGGFKLCLGH